MALLPRHLPACRAHLDGYARVFPSHLGGYPDIVPRDGHRVDGLLLETVDPKSLGILDAYEEVGRLYLRRPAVAMARGQRIACEVYMGITPP